MKLKYALPGLIVTMAIGGLFLLPGITGLANVGAVDHREIVLNWEQQHPQNHPSARWGHAMAYDSERGVTVLFGGLASSWQDDTWEWDGTNWTQKFPVTKPPRRLGHAMAYDSEREVTVLFGGWGDGGSKNDTWEWNGHNWTQIDPEDKPEARTYHALAYDSKRKVTVLFGYFDMNDNPLTFIRTWEWDGENWEPKFPVNNPVGRLPNSHVAMAYDSTRNVTVLLTNHSSSPLWEWGGVDWDRLTPSERPETRDHTSLAFDTARQRSVLFGGSFDLNDTWDWDGIAWTRHFPVNNPTERLGHHLAYDSEREVIVLFGGVRRVNNQTFRLSDTWEFGAVSVPDPTPTVTATPDPTVSPTPDPTPGPTPTVGPPPDPGAQKIYLPLLVR